ncbi:MAG: hemolysin family protein [Gemmatimonadota bacterium]|jgi:putative hemolysin
MVLLLVVIVVSLSISFLCSVLEAVLLSVTHAFVAVMEEQGSRAGRLLARRREKLDESIAAILTLNTIAHTVGAAVGGAMALQVFGEAWIAAFSAALTLAILVFSEILPKTLGATYWQVLAPPAAYVLHVLVIILKPVLVPLAWFNRLVSPKGDERPKVSRAELEILAEIGRREGVIDDEEWQVVTNVMNLDRVRVAEVMTPRTRITAVELSEGVEGAKALILDDGHSRIPVYRESLDDIVGVVLARDLWRAADSGQPDLDPVMREPRFVPESKPVEDLIEELRAERINLAIVVDEYGGTAGLVTLEDLIEEIVGEIQDEHEIEALAFEETAAGEVRVAGDVPVREVNERFGLELSEEDHATLAGWLLGSFGRVPQRGDEVVVAGGRFRVVRMDGRRIDRVAFRPDDAPTASGLPPAQTEPATGSE